MPRPVRSVRPATASTITRTQVPVVPAPWRGDGRKRIHRKGEDRIVRDERGEDVKRHERRMIARYGSVEGPRRRHSKKTRAPFRIAGR